MDFRLLSRLDRVDEVPDCPGKLSWRRWFSSDDSSWSRLWPDSAPDLAQAEWSSSLVTSEHEHEKCEVAAASNTPVWESSSIFCHLDETGKHTMSYIQPVSSASSTETNHREEKINSNNLKILLIPLAHAILGVVLLKSYTEVLESLYKRSEEI